MFSKEWQDQQIGYWKVLCPREGPLQNFGMPRIRDTVNPLRLGLPSGLS